MGQYLTGVFEMQPTRRKAAALERVRAGAEAALWQAVGHSSFIRSFSQYR